MSITLNDYPVTFGNNKIDKGTMIFNMSTATDCPEENKGFCQLCSQSAKCYAKGPEYRYADYVMPHRLSQQLLWQTLPIKELIGMLKEVIHRKRHKIVAIRLNESGGIDTIEDIKRLAQIAKAFPSLKVYTYTSRIDLWKAKSFDILPDNVTINGSGFMAHNKYIAVPTRKGIPKGKKKTMICPAKCGGTNCRACEVKRGLTIYSVIKRDKKEKG